MTILFGVYYIKKNAGIVDIGWALSFTLASWAYFFIGNGDSPKKWIITMMVTIWSLRLAWQLYQRFIATEEDARYRDLRKSWGCEGEDGKFFIMFIFQGVLAVFLSLPFLIVSANSDNIWYSVEGLGIFLWLIGVAGEALADHQLFEFKQNPENQGKVCQNGLWYYSRHPNYFFEFVVWLGFFFFALGTSGGWISIVAPVLMFYLLTQMSGIPLAEAQALKSRGEAYEEYQKRTSSFFPWFRKGD
jgi:steroid 5-alpha reductase family enzyme